MYNKKKKKKTAAVTPGNAVHEADVVKGCIVVKIHKDNVEIKKTRYSTKSSKYKASNRK